MPHVPFSQAAQLTAIGICLVATAIDMRTRRIPNPLSYASVVLGLGLAAISSDPGHTLGRALGGGLCLFVPFAVMGLRGIVGMGDVKLMAGVGALLGWPLALAVLVYTLFAGGLLAIVHGAFTGELAGVLRNIGRGKELWERGQEEAPVHLHRMPYAAAILAGTSYAVATRYWPLPGL